MINWDINDAIPDFSTSIDSIAKLKNESFVTAILPLNPFLQIQQDQNHNHRSFFVHPIHKSGVDKNSEIVALLCGGYSWDIELLSLLPIGVNGIVVEIRNTCNQTYSYQIDGPDVVFVGEGSKHEKTYEHMEVVRDLIPYSHSDFISTPGHCLYSIVRYETLYFVLIAFFMTTLYSFFSF
jgi:hypothetical protein